MSVWGIVGIIGLSGATALAWRMRTPSHAYLIARAPDLERWARLYPADQLPLVLHTLSVIRDSFLLRAMDVYHLEPEDLLRNIYAAAYPRKGPDALEFENLATALEEDFGVPQIVVAQGLWNASVSEVITWTIEHRGSTEE